MIKLVVTGSIGMGKSTTARMFVELGTGWKLYDADEIVHQLYQQGGAAVAPIAEIFPDAIEHGAVNRSILSKLILGEQEKIKQLESIVHPLTGLAQRDFIEEAEAEHSVGVVFDIPLFFETGKSKANSFADYVVVVSAPYAVQRERSLGRADMDEEKFQAILTRQMPDREKRALADFIVATEFGLDYARKQVKDILARII